MDSPEMDTHWGPQLPGHFDFTLYFQHIMFKIVPGIFTLLAVPFYIRKSLRYPQLVRPGALLFCKLGGALALVALQCANLGLWHGEPRFCTRAALAAASMSLLASLSILGILYVSHKYALRPSSFISAFLTVTALLDIAFARSCFRRAGLATLGALQTCAVVVKLFLILLEEMPKRSLILSEDERHSASRETLAGFWNRANFVWLNSLMLLGFSKQVQAGDLPTIDADFNLMCRLDKFQLKWNKVNRASPLPLARTLLYTVPWELAKAVLPRLIFVLLNFAQPFLLFRIVDSVTDGNSDAQTGRALIGATALVYFGITITRSLQDHFGYRAMTSVRGILVVAIFDKMQRLDVEQLAHGAAVTLMTADAPGVEHLLSLTYEFWSSSIQVALGLWSLSLFVGRACFLMLIPGFCSVLASHYISTITSKARTAWNEEIQSRVSATSAVLNQIKNVKAAGMSRTVSDYLQAKRNQEIQTSMQERHAQLWMFAFAALNNAVTPVIVLGGAYFWTRADGLSSADAFTILAIVSIASEPLILILQGVMEWTVGFASLRRIQSFLMLEEAEDSRKEGNPTTNETTTVDHEKPPTSSSPELAIDVQSMGFTSKGGVAVLEDINMALPWGKLAIIYGPVNTGKSTFLKTLIGESPISTGTVAVGTKRIAYCSQDPWMPNQTLRAAVIGIAEFIEERYRQVLFCCALDVDIQQMPNGDQTMTGTGGCNLSGGQNQRLSLARAAYTLLSIVVLDDVLSAVDADTAAVVVERLLGKSGLLRQRNCTVIMTTNRLEFLGYADQVYRMTDHGGMALEQRQPTSEPLLASDRAIKEPGLELSHTTVGVRLQKPPSQDAAVVAPGAQKDADWSLYGYYLLPAGMPWVISWVGFMMIAALIEKMPLIFTRIWYSRAPRNPYYFIGFALFSLASIACNTLMGVLFFFKILPKSAGQLHLRVLNTVLYARLDFLSETDSGFLLSRFSQDMALTAQELPLHFLQFAFMFFLALVEVGIVAAASAYAAPVMIFILVALYVIQLFYLRTSRQLRGLQLQSSEAILTHFTETCDGMQHIRSQGWTGRSRAELLSRLSRSQKPYYLLSCVRRWLCLSLDYTSTISAVILTTISILQPHSTSENALGLAMLSLVSFSTVASWLIQAWTNLETALAGITRIKSFVLDTPIEKDSLPEAEIPENWPSAGRIEFTTVSANYKTAGEAFRSALDSVTFTIQPGEKVGISGRTGSGKSSLFLTVLRMVDFSGQICIDGLDIASVPREHLRSKITALTQDGVELKASLRFNMYPFAGPIPDESEMISILELAGLWHHVENHGGLDEDLAKMCFSASQRQVFFVARAILHQKTAKTTIVLIDEATSAMSKEGDRHVQKIMDEAFVGCTVLQIAHHPDWLADVNTKLRMQFGKLVSLERLDKGQWVQDRNSVV